MILNDIEIRRRILTENLCTSVFKEDGYCIESDGVQPSSLDLRVGKDFLIPEPTFNDGGFVECNSFDRKPNYRRVTGDCFVLHPKRFVLATTMEYIKLPDDLTAFVEGRSSIGRLGLFVQNAGWVDAGFEGEITLELFNASDIPIRINSGTRIAQLVFCRMVGYAEYSYNGKYQKQIGATPSKINLDYERSKHYETD